MIGNCPECGEDYLNAKTIEDGKTYCWTRARCQCGHVFMFRVDPPGILEIAQNETSPQKGGRNDPDHSC